MLPRVIEFNLTHYPTHLIQEHDLNGQRIGYSRVSTFEQNPDRQLENVQVDRLFTDKLSGKDSRRPQLEAMLSFVREGDIDSSSPRQKENLVLCRGHPSLGSGDHHAS